MTEALYAVITFALLCGSVALGLLVQPYLREHHRSRETLDSVRLAITMIVTFAALILSLLIVSVKNSFDTAGNDLRVLAVSLIELDHALADYGPDAAQARRVLQNYTVGMITSTWPNEAPPASNFHFANSPPPPPDQPMESRPLGQMLYEIEADILNFVPNTPRSRVVAADCLVHWHDVMARRWHLIEVAHNSLSSPFMLVMVIWLMLIFGSFGLIMPRHLLSYTVLGLCAFSLALAVFVVLDLDTPFSGLIVLPSAPMREVLALAKSG